MSARQPRFEVVRGDAGWYSRFIAANGREVWRTSETYQRKGTAYNAIWLITGLWPGRYDSGEITTRIKGRPTEVRVLDERDQLLTKADAKLVREYDDQHRATP